MYTSLSNWFSHTYTHTPFQIFCSFRQCIQSKPDNNNKKKRNSWIYVRLGTIIPNPVMVRAPEYNKVNLL